MCATRWTSCVHGVPQGLFRVWWRGNLCAFSFFVVTGFTITLCMGDTHKVRSHDMKHTTRIQRKLVRLLFQPWKHWKWCEIEFPLKSINRSQKYTSGCCGCSPAAGFRSVGSYWMEANPSLFNHLKKKEKKKEKYKRTFNARSTKKQDNTFSKSTHREINTMLCFYVTHKFISSWLSAAK